MNWPNELLSNLSYPGDLTFGFFCDDAKLLSFVFNVVPTTLIDEFKLVRAGRYEVDLGLGLVQPFSVFAPELLIGVTFCFFFSVCGELFSQEADVEFVSALRNKDPLRENLICSLAILVVVIS